MINRTLASRMMPILLLTSVMFQAAPLFAQSGESKAKRTPERISIGVVEEIESTILGEKRKIRVSTPKGYDGKEKKFVTVYVLDGSYTFQHITALVEFLVRYDLMPPAIVIAVDTPNPGRSRDLTPKAAKPMQAFADNHGGADEFVAFLRDELIPHIEDEYPVLSHRTLIGHSLGGLFALHTLVHYGDTFDAYLAGSPSLLWDDQKLVKQSEKFFKDTGELNKSLYMTAGNEGGALEGGILKIAGILSEHGPRGFEWKHRIMREETHGSVEYRSARQGLEFIFADWAMKDPFPLYEQGGMAAVEQYYKASASKFGVNRPFNGSATLGAVYMKLVNAKRFDESLQLVKEDSQREKPFLPARAFPSIAGMYEDLDQAVSAKEVYRILLKKDPGNQKAREALVRLGVPEAELPEVEEQKDVEKKK